MTDGVTYAGALAACVGRWGLPFGNDLPGFAWWPRLPANEEPGCEMDGVCLSDFPTPHLVATGWGASEVIPVGDALPDALDAADRWLRTHAHP